MKYLIGESRKVKWKGEFARADESKGEFIFDTESDTPLIKAELHDIAKVNGVEVGSKDNVATLVEKIDQHFSTLNMKEINAMSDEAKVEEIVLAGTAVGKDEDTMLVEIVNAGVSFKNAIKLFKSVMESKGLKISAKKRADQINEILDEAQFKPETLEQVQAMIGHITKTVADTNDKQAIGAIRRWARRNEIEMPKMRAPAGPGGGFRGRAFAWIIEHPAASAEEFTAWVTDPEGGKKDEAAANRFLPLFEVITKAAANLAKVDEAKAA